MGADVVQMVMAAGGALAFAAAVLGRRKNRKQRSPPSVDRPDAPATQAAVFALQPDVSPAAAPQNIKSPGNAAATQQIPLTNGNEAPPSPDMKHKGRTSPEGGRPMDFEVGPALAPPTPSSAGVSQDSGDSPATYSDAETPPPGNGGLSRRSQGGQFRTMNGSVSGGGSSGREIVQKLRNQLRSREDIIYEMQGQMRELELLSHRQVARCGELERGEAQAQKARNVVMRENFEVREELKRLGKKVEGLAKDKEEAEEEMKRLRAGMGKGRKSPVGRGSTAGDLETKNGQLERELRELRGQNGPLQERQVASLQRNLAAAVERQQEAERELNVAVREAREANESRHEARGSERRAEEREREAVGVAERLRRDIEGVEEELREARKGWERAKQEVEGVAREGNVERASLHRAIADLKTKLDSEVGSKDSPRPEARIPRAAPRVPFTGSRTTSLAVKRPLWAPREGSPAASPARGPAANRMLPAMQSGAAADGSGNAMSAKSLGSKEAEKQAGSDGLNPGMLPPADDGEVRSGGQAGAGPGQQEQVAAVGREGDRWRDRSPGQEELNEVAKQLDGLNRKSYSKSMEQEGDGGDGGDGGEEGKQNRFPGGVSDTASDGTLDDLLDNALDDMFQVCSNNTTPVKAQPGEEGR